MVFFVDWKYLKYVLSLVCKIIASILKTTMKIIKFDIKSAFVKTWTPEISEAIKYLLPTAAKIAPNEIANFEFSSFLIGNRNMRSEIKNDKIPPKNNFMNNHDPDLDISRLYTRVSVTSGLNELGDVCIKSCSSLLYS